MQIILLLLLLILFVIIIIVIVIIIIIIIIGPEVTQEEVKEGPGEDARDHHVVQHRLLDYTALCYKLRYYNKIYDAITI